MAFMKPQITKDNMVLVETDAGDWLVPTDVYDPEKPLECTEGSELYGTEDVSGWFARLSAPGHMDCTDWMGPFETEWEARAELSESFEVCPHCGDPLDENGCPECGADSLVDRPDYVGDRDYCNGGTWFNVAEWKQGYVTAIEVCPVPGLDGAVWVSYYVTLTPEAETVDEALEDERVRKAVDSCGWLDEDEIRERPSWRLILASALFDYGFRDPDSYISPVVVQTESEGEMEGEGVEADYRIPDGTALELFLTEKINWAPGDSPEDPDGSPDGSGSEAAMEAVRDLLGAEGEVIFKTFDAMEIAEEEIEKAKAAHPDHAEDIHHAFGILRPPALLIEKPLDPLFRHFCAEILERVAAGEDLTAGTDAEILAALCETSLQAPLSTSARTLYMRIFRDIYGETVSREIFDEDVDARVRLLMREFGALVEDLEISLRRKLQDPERKLSNTAGYKKKAAALAEAA